MPADSRKEDLMGLLGKLFGKEEKTIKEEAAPSPPAEPIACPHAALTPRWDSVDDMGKEDLATAFVCDACHESFTPEEARLLRESVAERLVGHAESLN
jgi:hypothetical protein